MALTKKQQDAAKDRRVKAKQSQQEAIRNKFKGIEYARQLDECYKHLDDILKDLQKAKTAKAKLTKKDVLDLSIIRGKIEILNAQRETIKVKIDLNLKRLKFVVPELKSVELSDPNGDNPYSSFTEMLIEATRSNVI